MVKYTFVDLFTFTSEIFAFLIILSEEYLKYTRFYVYVHVYIFIYMYTYNSTIFYVYVHFIYTYTLQYTYIFGHLFLLQVYLKSS